MIKSDYHLCLSQQIFIYYKPCIVLCTLSFSVFSLLSISASCVSLSRSFFLQFGKNLCSEGLMTDDGTLSKLNNDIAACAHTHIDQTEGLRDALAIVVQRQVLVIGLHVLSHFVFDPLKSNSLLEHSLMERFSFALLLEK